LLVDVAFGEAMRYVIVYWSRYGNNKRIVDYVAQALKNRGAETQVFKTDEVDFSAFPQADVYIFSAPAEAFNLQRNMRKFLKNLQGLDGKKYGIINTHGMNRNWLSTMEKLLSKKMMVKAASVEFHVGKDAQTGNALMEGWEEKLDEFVLKV
jgi:flavodoxin